MRCLIFLMLFFVGCCDGSRSAPYVDKTREYQMPPELKRCKIYVLGGGWSSTYPIWVVVNERGSVLNHKVEVDGEKIDEDSFNGVSALLRAAWINPFSTEYDHRDLLRKGADEIDRLVSELRNK